VPIAAIALDFDPVVRLGDAAIRLQLVAVAAALLVTLLAAAAIARRHGLRLDDVLFIAVGAVPGAVIGGRLGYVLAHVDHFAASPQAIVDPAQGGLALGGAVIGGTTTAALVARLLGAPLGTWLRVAAVPLLGGIILGKLAMLVGGSGLGRPSELPWAVAFTGPGPWGSLAADIPSHPAQVYEAVAALAVLLLVGLLASSSFPRDGRLFAVAVGGWAVGRFVVGFVWRDSPVIGPFGAEQAMSALIALGAAGVFALYALRRVTPTVAEPDDGAAPEWPDPATRPPF
jgi:phosphatidylglycerol:prolipoprotein diacylglycerol transferase